MVLAAHNIEQLGKARILVIGDVMLDRYWMGGVDRISPEAPVPIVAVSEVVERAGGAGNVARNITSLGGRCTLLGIVGDDEAGAKFNEITTASGVEVDLEIQKGLDTTVKLRVLSRNQQLLRADFETLPDRAALDSLAKRFSKRVSQYDAVIFSDYGKGTLADVTSLITIARQKSMLILVDPKGSDFKKYSGATIITPNLDEFQLVAGDVATEDDLRTKAEQLIENYDLDKLLVTLSDKGMTLFEKGQPQTHIGAKTREVYDVSGAGDTVIAVMAMAMATGLDSEASVKVANSAAGLVISKLGTATTDIRELQQAVLEDYQ